MKKLYLGIIILLIGLISGCGENAPSKKQLKEDIAPYVSECEIEYYIDDPMAYYNTSSYYETLDLSIKSINVEKSLCKDNTYEAWLSVELENDTIRPTAYLYVNYLGYDNNHWELQTCEEYDETVAEYVGNFNLDNIKQMFDSDIEVTDIELLDYDTGNTAEVKITGINHKGICIAGWDNAQKGNQEPEIRNTYDYDINFEMVSTFEFDSSQGAWKTSNARDNLVITTNLDENIIETAAKELFSSIKDTQLSFDNSEYQFDGMDDESLDDIASITDGDTVAYLAYDFIHPEKLYEETAVLSCDIFYGSFSEMPLLTYAIRGRIGGVNKEWKIDASKDRMVNSSYGYKKQVLNYHVVYPYNGDPTAAYITVHDTTYDSNSEHDIENVYEVKDVNTDLMTGLMIKSVCYPRAETGNDWGYGSSDMYITYDEIYFEYSELPWEYKSTGHWL